MHILPTALPWAKPAGAPYGAWIGRGYYSVVVALAAVSFGQANRQDVYDLYGFQSRALLIDT